MGPEPVWAVLHRHRITFQDTSTWKDSTDLEPGAKPVRIEEVQASWPDRTFVFV